ncbi:MAG: RNB domain-containing ribonuclease, partial [Erysipelatoclostridium sp.]|nr:RNB domain-containing ribonuclease [Thomasclavelia sp.]
DLFFLMKELAEILQKTREDRGAIDFDTNEAKVLVDEKGKPTDVVLRQRGESDRIIESFMLVANETVAKHFKWLDLPFIYRVHENPKVDKLRKFSTISRTLGYTIKGSLEDIHSKELSKIVEASKGTDEHVIISTLLLRCMAKARYDEQCLGHFGLADEYYTHFTSPIRRYPDLMVHRLIRTYLFKKKLDQETLFHFASIMQNVADQASSLERKAIDIEREVDDMKMAEYMEDHIGETFEGIVSSITNFGMFVELPNTIEGLIRMEDLVDDFYYFDDINLQLIGKRTGRRFKMSDKVKIKVSAASKREKTIDFQIVGMKSNKKKKKTVIINKRRDRKPKQKFKRKRR